MGSNNTQIIDKIFVYILLLLGLTYPSVASSGDNSSYPIAFFEASSPLEKSRFYLNSDSGNSLIQFDEKSDEAVLASLQCLDPNILELNSDAGILKGIYVVGERVKTYKDKSGATITKFRITGWCIKSPFLLLLPDETSLSSLPKYRVVQGRLSFQNFDFRGLSFRRRRNIANLRINWKSELKKSWIGKPPNWFPFLQKTRFSDQF